MFLGQGGGGGGVLSSFIESAPKNLAPLFCFESCIRTTQYLFNLIICLYNRGRVLYIYTYLIRKILECKIQ
jgi:hypothetical protein